MLACPVLIPLLFLLSCHSYSLYHFYLLCHFVLFTRLHVFYLNDVHINAAISCKDRMECKR
jgi:hypothetical protein